MRKSISLGSPRSAGIVEHAKELRSLSGWVCVGERERTELPRAGDGGVLGSCSLALLSAQQRLGFAANRCCVDGDCCVAGAQEACAEGHAAELAHVSFEDGLCTLPRIRLAPLNSRQPTLPSQRDIE